MKKIVLCLSVIFALFALVSCKDDVVKNIDTDENANANKEIIVEDWYFFRTYDGGNFQISHGINRKSPIKINPVSKNATFICIDPLCNHDGIDCPLFGSGTMYIAGNYLFYTSGIIWNDAYTGEQLGSVILYAYDMLNGNTRQIVEYKDKLIIAGGAANYLYYYIAQYNEEDSRLVTYTLHRADAKSGNIIEIGDYSYEGEMQGNINYPNIYTIIDNKIYWWSSSEDVDGAFYTTDLDGKNRKDIDLKAGIFYIAGILSKYDNGYAYYTMSNRTPFGGEYEFGSAMRDNRLFRILLDDGVELELIAESVITYALCGDKIYYTVLEENPKHIEYPEVETWNWSGGKVYVMNSDGTDKKLVCETGYDLSDYREHGFFEVKTIDGIDYIAVSYTILVSDRFAPSSDTLIINASTGEYTVVSVPE